MMLEKKTSREIWDKLLNPNFILNHTQHSVWVSKDSLIKYLDGELNDLHTRLSDKELSDVCQANLSGAIIWLDCLKEELKGEK